MRQGRTRWVAIGAAVSVWSLGQAKAQQVQVSPSNRTIAITTTETSERRADVATLHIGFRVYAPDSTGAYAAGAAISQAVAAALARVEVPPEAIASESQSIGPVEDYQNNLKPDERAQHRFQAQQSWSIKITPAAVAQVLAEAVAAGANESGQVDWTVADEDTLVAEAGVKALAHARAQAAQMATGMGARIGNLLYASNQVEMAGPKPIFYAMNRPTAVLKEAPRLSLRAPMVTRSATVSAIFAVE